MFVECYKRPDEPFDLSEPFIEGQVTQSCSKCGDWGDLVAVSTYTRISTSIFRIQLLLKSPAECEMAWNDNQRFFWKLNFEFWNVCATISPVPSSSTRFFINLHPVKLVYITLSSSKAWFGLVHFGVKFCTHCNRTINYKNSKTLNYFEKVAPIRLIHAYTASHLLFLPVCVCLHPVSFFPLTRNDDTMLLESSVNTWVLSLNIRLKHITD